MGMSRSSLRIFPTSASFLLKPGGADDNVCAPFLSQTKYAELRKWPRLLQAIKLAAERVEKLAQGSDEQPADAASTPDAAAAAPSSKRRRTLQAGVLDAWRELHAGAEAVERQVSLFSRSPPAASERC